MSFVKIYNESGDPKPNKDGLPKTNIEIPMPECKPPKASNTVKVSKANFWDKDEIYCEWYNCPHCEEHWIKLGFLYCPICGAEIIWE